MKTRSLFQEGKNCWRVEKVSRAAMLIDCANYYRALHEAIFKAQHSIFILGWDIDSRIELLRGSEAKEAGCPATFFDLIQWKARCHPQMEIYLNRWNYSIFFVEQREAFSDLKWRIHSPPNIHYCLDGQIPYGASHHQKVVVIDDEIAFCGGMDVALARWDHREHHPKEAGRADPANLAGPEKKVPFDPYHDIQIVVSGPIAAAFGELARERWRLAAGFDPIAVRQANFENAPYAWPASAKTCLSNVDAAIALTIPPEYDQPPVKQIERLYIDLIRRAEKFIYMENQYYTHLPVAYALNRQLRKKPDLRVLAVGCHNPHGRIEGESMWSGRVKFGDVLRSGGVADRALLAYPMSREDGEEKDIHIHSKIMIIDDRYLRVGSSNCNHRSMGFDTECDLVIEADEATRPAIAAIRNDLIREHTGRELADIERLAQGEAKVEEFLTYLSHSRQHLCKINDEKYRRTPLGKISRKLGDPEKPIIPGEWTMPYRYAGTKRNLPQRLFVTIFILALVIGFALLWKVTPLAEYASTDKIVELLERIRSSPWAIPVTLGLYLVGGLIFFPVNILTAATAIAFGPVPGAIISMVGSMLGAAIGFLVGRWLGLRSLRVFLGALPEKAAQYAKNSNVAGITMLRLIPIAPFGTINMALGVANVPFRTYLAGTFLGLLPGKLVVVFLGTSLLNLIEHPDTKSILFTAAIASAWIAIVIMSHFIVRRWQERRFAKPAE
ncbi:MAG TPA: VTT domain-containing protein [Patescibacteria group bacterium]|nr:VTT domain-containing protein [Patescibacteria group bacterium]